MKHPINYKPSNNQVQFRKFKFLSLGTYDLNEIMGLMQKREEEKSKVLNNLMKETNREKCELEEKYKAMMEK